MQRTRSINFCAALILMLCAWTSPALTQTAARRSTEAGARTRNTIEAIAAGANIEARRTAITQRLDELGIRYRLEQFSHAERRGTNIIAELTPETNATTPATQRTLLLGAHYDRVERGAGAVDNASGSAAVLELLAVLKANPLRNHRVSAAFFDLEEVGLVGSREYVAVRGRENLPSVFVNFDVFGYGDTLYVMSRDERAPSNVAVRRAASERNFALRIGADYPPSDHLTFLRARTETLSISLLNGDELDSLIALTRHERPRAMPRVMTIIHTGGDTIDKIDAEAVARALPVVERALRLLDETAVSGNQ